MQAPQVRHAHSVSSLITSPTISTGDTDRTSPLACPAVWRSGPTEARCAFRSWMRCIGDSGWPDTSAGQTSVQRPQRTQASSSKSCFQVKSCTCPTPNTSCSSMFSMVARRPGASVRRKKALTGAKIMWSSRVNTSSPSHPNASRMCAHHDQVCAVSMCPCVGLKMSRNSAMPHDTNDQRAQSGCASSTVPSSSTKPCSSVV